MSAPADRWWLATLGRTVVWARQRGDAEVMLHAQCSAEGFYRRLGFTARGLVFEEAGVQHIEMVLPLISKEAE